MASYQDKRPRPLLLSPSLHAPDRRCSLRQEKLLPYKKFRFFPCSPLPQPTPVVKLLSGRSVPASTGWVELALKCTKVHFPHRPRNVTNSFLFQVAMGKQLDLEAEWVPPARLEDWRLAPSNRDLCYLVHWKGQTIAAVVEHDDSEQFTVALPGFENHLLEMQLTTKSPMDALAYRIKAITQIRSFMEAQQQASIEYERLLKEKPIRPKQRWFLRRRRSKK